MVRTSDGDGSTREGVWNEHQVSLKTLTFGTKIYDPIFNI